LDSLHPDSPPAGGRFLAALNPRQLEAVTQTEGPLLVLAGAGSGKTRVITYRIVHLLLDHGVAPASIIAVTFTNKAAGEMRERIEKLLWDAGVAASRPFSGFGYWAPSSGWIGTFHSLCLRILRQEGERIGLARGFAVLDSDDQVSLVKRLLREEDAEDATGNARSVLSWISRHKNAMTSPDHAARLATSPENKQRARVYAAYQDALRKANAADFDDLLVRTLELFEEHADIADRYAERCRYLLVDEYQDTNRPQYLLVRALSSVHGNVCVVGDEDQSIYRFRGAEIRNILDFEKDHPGAAVVKLEENYRSTGTILDAAGAVVAHNVARKGKVLWTQNGRGELIDLFRAPDDRAEAEWVSQRLRELSRQSAWDQLAVLYRTNAQSRQFEEAFRRDRIPYQVVGAVGFYERKEVKDLLAYLKLMANPSDDVSFRRIVNTPARGIGDTSVAAIEEVAQTRGLPLLLASHLALEQGKVGPRAARPLAEFLDLIEDLAQRAEGKSSVAALLDGLIKRLDFENHLERTNPGQGADRMENVRALVSAAVEYEEEAQDPEGTGLTGFLDRSALVSDADEIGRERGVTLMTAHLAKGLEFDAVFLPGLEENLFPHARANVAAEDLEEERRLLYVAMTRARKRLFVSHAGFRRLRGELLPNPPSRFLEEIPSHLVREVKGPGSGFLGRGPWTAREERQPEERWSASGSSAARAVVRKPVPPPAVLPTLPGPRAVEATAYPVGATVKHPMFGMGKVVNSEGSGQSLKLTIHFVQHGAKKILPAYTKLLVQG
jgi:DNA helicase-2/ATP-dependent DNA helicase PcrA